MVALHSFGKRFYAIFFHFRAIFLRLDPSGLNCKFIRRKYDFSINLKISLISSYDMPISAKNLCRLRYFGDFDIKVVVLGQNSFE